jgi:hypothetical protein
VIDERSDRYTGTYHFQAFNVIHFDASEQHDVLAYPIEKKHFIVGREAMR